MPRTMDAEGVNARLHAESVEEPVVVVWIAVALVHGHVDLVRALDKLEAVDRERYFSVACEPLGVHLLEIGVRAVAADAIGVEQSESKDEVVGGIRCAHFDSHRHWLAGMKHVRSLRLPVEERHVDDFHFARTPSPFDRPMTVNRPLRAPPAPRGVSSGRL